MDSQFSGMQIALDTTKVRLVFPTKLKKKTANSPVKRSTSQHIHYEVEIHFIFAGKYRLITSQKELTLSSNCVCVIPKGHSHQIFPEEGSCDSFNVLAAFQNRSCAGKATMQLWNGLQDVQVFSNCDRICQHIWDFREAFQKDGEINEQIKESLLTLAFCRVTEELSVNFPNRSKVAEACKLPYDGNYFDAELENYIMVHYKGKLSREALAKHLGISSAQLGRIIHRNYGMNFSQLVTRLRMEDTKKLLQTDMTIAEIGRSLGYTTYNGFAAAFKKYYGVTPESMRKEHKL